MNATTITVLLVSLFLLFILSEAMGFVAKIRSNKFFTVFHFAGGGLAYLLFLNLTKNNLLSLLLVVVVGILWEIHEWILWKFFLKKRIYRPGGADTKEDLLMDLLGALVFYVIEIISKVNK